jgi:hypothetical protein
MSEILPYIQAATFTVEAGLGLTCAYRRIGVSVSPPLVLLQHFRGNFDNRDPALIDALSAA